MYPLFGIQEMSDSQAAAVFTRQHRSLGGSVSRPIRRIMIAVLAALSLCTSAMLSAQPASAFPWISAVCKATADSVQTHFGVVTTTGNVACAGKKWAGDFITTTVCLQENIGGWVDVACHTEGPNWGWPIVGTGVQVELPSYGFHLYRARVKGSFRVQGRAS